MFTRQPANGIQTNIQRNRTTGVVTHQSNFLYGMGDRYTDRSDYVRSRKPTGWKFPKPYALTVVEDAGVSGTNFTLGPSISDLVYGNVTPNYGSGWAQGSTPTASASLKQRAEVQALLALKNQKVNLALAYQERKMTAKLLGDTAFRLGRAFNAIKRRDWRDAANQLRLRPSDVKRIMRKNKMKPIQSWLELQYGWKPFLSDVYGTASLLQSKSDPKKWVVTVKGRAKEYETNKGSVSPGSRFGHLWRMEGFHSAFVRLDYEPASDFMRILSNTGFSNPLLLNWERLPYSFVVDWALPIGDWLATMDAAQGYNFISGSCSIWTDVVQKKDSVLPDNLTSASIKGSYKMKKLVRTVYTSSPLPRPPSVKNPASLLHMANGLSLLAQAFGRGGQSRTLRL